MKHEFASFLLALVALFHALVAVAAEPIGFNRDIRPIFAEKCTQCHGPDSASRKADLRLDRRESAIEVGAIAPGKPDESELIARIDTSDPKEVMPPPSSHKTLSKAEKDLLRRWVAEGAKYEPHWSFIAPKRPALPAVKQADWVRNPIDRFVLSRLEASGLTPAPEADRRTLARRLSFDLTGLPPDPAEVDAFVNDKAADAYERLIDRWMAKPEWGEHRGRYWLDAARYADTHGIHFDNFRENWTFREWVVGAFNRHMPFDQFTIEQLAGDLLPNRTLDQQIASGFNRCNITTNEGGVIAEEYLVLYTRDRTETTSQVWLGVTANCAVCHDHKFDPLPQKEFYRMAAFFNNTTQGAMDGNIKDTPPVAVVARPEDRLRYSLVSTEASQARARMDGRKQEARQDFSRWKPADPAAACAAAIPQRELVFHAPLAPQGDRVSVNVGCKTEEVRLSKPAVTDAGHVADRALRIEPGMTMEVPEAGDFERDGAFTVAAWIKLPKNARSGAIAARMDDQHGYRGWDLWAEGGRVGTHIIHQWPDDALKVVTKNPISSDAWNHVAVSYDGSGKAKGVRIYVNGQVQENRPASDKLKGSIRTKVALKVGQRNSGSRIDGLAVQDIRLYSRALAAGEIVDIQTGTRAAYLASKPADKRSKNEQEDLFQWWVSHLDSVYKGIQTKLAALEKEQNEIKARGTIAHVMEERKDAPMAYVLHRGEYDKRRDEVKPETPTCLPPMPADLPRNRLGFAQWLLRPEHPLTARVTVNRFWQEVFGQGIVRTSGDFGVSGEAPSNPELLDWLAVEFRETGWDVRRLFRLMLLSATYRQSAASTPAKLEKDPQNRLLSRGPRFRMDAEMVRDTALAASSLLVRKIGGPSVRPYQPEGVWEAVAMIGSNTREYKQDHGEDLYRRSMYTFWKRSAPPASMDIFNAPSREVCTVRRERTNTPLQALATLNDPQMVEAARNLAARALTEVKPASDAASINFIARRLLSRSLGDAELAVVQKSLATLLAYYAGHEADAKALIAVGESKADPGIPPAKLAGWTMLANELMNLDEVLNK